jgi:hypothetical protein
VTWTLVGSDAVGFADGGLPGSGHVYTLPAGAPAAGDLDVLTVNSDTVVTMPDGWSGAATFVGSQGSYLWYRIAAGGEADSVTIVTAGNFDTVTSWSRWTGAQAFDLAALAHADASSGMATPPVSTGALAGVGELVIAFAALHSFGTPPATPVWSTGYTALAAGQLGVVAALVGYSTTGTGIESPSVSWTNEAVDRYALVAAFAPLPSDARGLLVTVGAMDTKWNAGPPEPTGWSAGSPELGWAASRPTA